MDYASTIIYGLISVCLGGAFTLGVAYVGFYFGYRHGHRLFEESTIEPSGWVDDHDLRKSYKAHIPKQAQTKIPELR